MSDETSTETIYCSRWVVCEDCECATLIERDDDRGVPESAEWEEFGRCLVCGSSQHHWNADEGTTANRYWRMGRRAERSDTLRGMAKDFRDIGMTEAAELCDEKAAAGGAPL